MADISAAGTATMVHRFDPADDVQAEAAARIEERARTRRSNVEQFRAGVAIVDTEVRKAKRADRIRSYLAGEAPAGAPVAVPGPGPVVADVDGRTLEQVINSADFVGIRFLEAGLAAARAVGRVNVRNASQQVTSYGTASLISAQLALTNHHVLPTADVARRSAIEFNYQDGIDGHPLLSRMFPFDPDRFYLADKDNDFAIVAVSATEEELAEFGFNRLINVEGKAVVGEFVTIVQHPRGEKKQVSLRENRVVDLLDMYIHYATDTEPGSSGSPVFNDQWEIVALHHASVAAPDRAELGGMMNEGIRVSALLRSAQARAQELPAPMARLLEGVFLYEPSAGAQVAPSPRPGSTTAPRRLQSFSVPEVPVTETRIVVPIEIIVRIGTPPAATVTSTGPVNGSGYGNGLANGNGHTNGNGNGNGHANANGNGHGDRSTVAVALPPAAPAASPLEPARPFQPAEPAEEAIRIDPDYSNRKGYDPTFLGPEVPLPELPAALLAKAALLTTPGPGPRHVLPYHHFSVVMNRERGLAFFTAVNIDGTLGHRLRRETDRWTLDPRIAKAAQIGEAVYADNALDRGHLVRRLDPAWGPSAAAAKPANDDTFHFTNCTPQHKDFNQRQTSWAGLEDFVLENAENHDLKVTVFTGPILAPDDDVYRGVKLPRQFWKVVVMARGDGRLSATGYLLSQEKLIHGLESVEEFSYGAYRTFQVPVARVARLSGLSFGNLASADPLHGLESTELFHEVGSPADLVL